MSDSRENQVTPDSEQPTSEVKPSPLTLSKQTIRVLSVKTQVRAGACSSCPSRISHISDTVMT
jgi:hypothetical protein